MGGKRKVPDFSKEKPAALNDSPFYGFKLDAEQLVFANTIWKPEVDIVFFNCKSGCGKTLIATGVANMLVQYGEYSEIIYTMSPTSERKLGYLPGGIQQKTQYYFMPFYQALVKCNVNSITAVNTESLENQKDGTGYITVITDTFLRGSTLDDAIVLIDKAQNYTFDQLKKVLTRVGQRTKVVMIGHDQQCDLDRPETSGFGRYIEHFRDQPHAAVCTLTTNYRSWISAWADQL